MQMLSDWNQWKLTIGLIAACVVVALMTGFGADIGNLRQLLIDDPDTSTGLFSSILSGEVWRLLTPMLIHFGPMHLVFNMYWLWDLGRPMEFREGIGRYALLIGIFAAGSSVLQYVVAGPYFGGMSGVVYGLICYVWARGKFQPLSGYRLGQNDFFLAVFWYLLCWTGAFGAIANWAHTGGLALGLAFGYFDARGGYVQRPGSGAAH